MKTFQKIVIAFTLSFFIAPFIYAQDIVIEGNNQKNNEIKTLFKSGRHSNGFYGSLSIGYTLIDKKDAVTFSARGCWIIDHSFGLGLGGSSFINDIQNLDKINVIGTENKQIAGGYGGLILEPIVFPLKPIHLSFPVLLGVGGVSNINEYYDVQYTNSSDVFLVVEPSVEIELNLTRFFRLAATAGYRFTSNIEMEGISKNALNNYCYGLTFKFGKF